MKSTVDNYEKTLYIYIYIYSVVFMDITMPLLESMLLSLLLNPAEIGPSNASLE